MARRFFVPLIRHGSLRCRQCLIKINTKKEDASSSPSYRGIGVNLIIAGAHRPGFLCAQTAITAEKVRARRDGPPCGTAHDPPGPLRRTFSVTWFAAARIRHITFPVSGTGFCNGRSAPAAIVFPPRRSACRSMGKSRAEGKNRKQKKGMARVSASCLIATGPGFSHPADGQGRLIYKVIAGFYRGFSFLSEPGAYEIFPLFSQFLPGFSLGREEPQQKRTLLRSQGVPPCRSGRLPRSPRGQEGAVKDHPHRGTSVIREHVSRVKPCDKCSAPCFQLFTTLSIDTPFPGWIGKYGLSL